MIYLNINFFIIFSNNYTKGVRAFIGVGYIANGTCAGDSLIAGAIYEDTIEQCKSNCGATEIKTVLNVFLIAGDGCGVNLCFGNETDIYNPGIRNK